MEIDVDPMEARIDGLRLALGHAEGIELGELPDAIADRTALLEERLKRVLWSAASTFDTRQLDLLTNRLALETGPAMPDLLALLDTIRACTPTGTRLVDPADIEWSEPLSLAAELLRAGGQFHARPRPRRDNVREALTRLSAAGHHFVLSGSGVDATSPGFATATANVRDRLGRLGRFEAFAQLEWAARRVHGYEFDQVLYGRSAVNEPRSASPPFGFLWQVAATVPDVFMNTVDPGAEWRLALEVATDLVALVNVETYGQFWMLGADVHGLSELLADATLHDHLFAVKQWLPHLTPRLLRTFFGSGLDERMRAARGWCVEDAAVAAETMIMVVEASPALISRQHLESRLAPETVDALLADIVHRPPAPNASYASPFDARSADLMFRPLVAGRTPDTFLLPSLSTAGPAFYEAVFQSVRGILDPREVGDLNGKGLERAVGDLLAFRGIQPSVMGGTYTVGPVIGECDVVVEDVDVIIFFECKAKAITRAAMSGDRTDAVLAYLEAITHAQAQGLKHETILVRDGHIVFNDGSILEHRGRKIVRVTTTLHDFGTLQDRFLFAHLGAVIAAGELSSADSRIRKRVREANGMIAILRRELAAELGNGVEQGERAWARLLPTASVSYGHLGVLLVENDTPSKLAKVLSHPLTAATGSVLKEYHHMRSQGLL